MHLNPLYLPALLLAGACYAGGRTVTIGQAGNDSPIAK